MRKAAQFMSNKPKEVPELVPKKDSSPLKRRVTLMPPKSKAAPARSRTKQQEQLNSAQARKESGNDSDDFTKKADEAKLLDDKKSDLMG